MHVQLNVHADAFVQTHAYVGMLDLRQSMKITEDAETLPVPEKGGALQH